MRAGPGPGVTPGPAPLHIRLATQWTDHSEVKTQIFTHSWLELASNKTKYFRLRLSYKVTYESERPESDLRLTSERPEEER